MVLLTSERPCPHAKMLGAIFVWESCQRVPLHKGDTLGAGSENHAKFWTSCKYRLSSQQYFCTNVHELLVSRLCWAKLRPQAAHVGWWTEKPRVVSEVCLSLMFPGTSRKLQNLGSCDEKRTEQTWGIRNMSLVVGYPSSHGVLKEKFNL